MKVSILRLLVAISAIAVIFQRSANADAPAGRYVVTAGNGTGNGTVYDTKSKLTWQQTTPTITYTRGDAQKYCASVGASLVGAGWRLPTLRELQSIVDYSQWPSPAIDPNAFPNTPSSNFWSTSGYYGFVDFIYGQTGITNDSSKKYNVRCVR